MKRTFPYTSDDLRKIAAQIDEIEASIGGVEDSLEDDWRWGLSVTITLDELPAGNYKACGYGWMGFYPHEVAE